MASMSQTSVYLNMLCRWLWGTLQSDTHCLETKACVWAAPQTPFSLSSSFSSVPRGCMGVRSGTKPTGRIQGFCLRWDRCRKLLIPYKHSLLEKVGRTEWKMAWQYSGTLPPVLISKETSVFWEAPTNTRDIVLHRNLAE